MAWRVTLLGLVALLGMGNPFAAEVLKDKAVVEQLLKGTTLNGIYLRTQSEYRLEFRSDGTLINQAGAEGRWWVSEEGQYCREWLSGPLTGNQACLEIVKAGEQIEIYSQGKKVAEGRLTRH